MPRTLICLALVMAGPHVVLPVPALAAESYDSCSGFITSLPVTITTQGVWCLDRDLSTAISSGNAITVATNNVTIDCNHFKVGGLQAGPGTTARGIRSVSLLNTTVRNCNVRGFYAGVEMLTGGGHLIEGGRFDGNTYQGISVFGAGSTVRDNQVVNTGGSTFSVGAAYGISAGQGTDVINNTVNGVAPLGPNANPYGIQTSANGDGSVIGNRVRGLVPTDAGVPRGIYNLDSGRIVVRNNTVQGPGNGIGIFCSSNQGTTRNNLIAGFANSAVNCLPSLDAVNPN